MFALQRRLGRVCTTPAASSRSPGPPTAASAAPQPAGRAPTPAMGPTDHTYDGRYI